MKLCKIAAAYAALDLLCEREWDYQEACDLLALRRALSPHAAFFAEEEAKLAAAFGEKDENGRVKVTRGHFSLAADADPAAYRGKYAALAAVEITPEWNTVTVTSPARIAPLTVEALTDFVIFAGGGV